MSTFNARAALFLLAPLALSGCGKPAPSGNLSSAADPAAGKPTTLEPGRWELAVSVERDYVRPFGSAPAEPGREPEPLMTSRTVTVCVTPDLAEAPGPVLITASDAIDRCQRNVWHMKDGGIDGDLTCPIGNGGSIPLRISGSYRRDKFSSEATEGSLGIIYQEKVEAKRTGACTADDRPTWSPRSSSSGG